MIRKEECRVEAVKTAAAEIKRRYLELNNNERFVLVSVIFIFIPVNVSALTTAAFLFYALFFKENRAAIAHTPRIIFVAAWAVLAIAAGAACGNFLGDSLFLFYLCFIAFSCYAFAVMTRRLCEYIVELMLSLSWAALTVAAVQFVADRAHRPVSVFYNANYYGFICELLIIACVFFFSGSRRRRLFFGLSGAANAAGLLLSGCRSAWPAVLAGVIVIFALDRNKRALLLSAAVGAGAGAVLLLHPNLIPRFDSITSTKTLRSAIWRTAWNCFTARPVLGGGFMRYWQVSADLGSRVHQPHAHNLLLNALLCYGVVGVALLMCFIVPALISCAKKTRIRRECVLVLACAAAILVHGITDDPILGMQTGIFSMLFMTFGGAVENPPQCAEAPAPAPAPAPAQSDTPGTCNKRGDSL
jgi:O-antigen ligase